MPALKILPGHIANMIAAGEVVQRPASVVKELMENAVDAGATSVTVVATDAGRTLVQVIDNGCGMSPDDALLCFERHATSKIATAEDLEQILTFGFRGEALASIAAVAEVTLKTRRPKDEVATQVRITAYNHIETSQTAAPVGSSFAVRNLFYNTPARRKFLKSDNVELRHIVEEFTRIALTRPDLSFTLTHNGRDLFVLKPAKSLKYRAQDLLGANVAGELVDIEAQTSLIRITGFVGRPDTARKTLGNQFFFVNGRYFRSPYLHKAVMKAYEGYIPEGVTPSYFLYLDIDPHAVDVNIHPTKTEIKFEDDSLVFQVLYASIKETLGKNAFGAGIDFEAEGAVQLPVLGSNFDQYRPVTSPAVEFDPDYNPFESSGPAPVLDFPVQAGADRQTGRSGAQASGGPSASGGAPSGYSLPRTQNYGKLFEETVLPSSRVLLLQERYILTPVKSGVMAIHLRRAQERILYERFLRAMTADRHVTQTALFPVQVNVGVENRLLFDAHEPLLQRLGFDITPFGSDTVVVNGVPEGYSCEAGKIERMIYDILLILNDESKNLKEMMESATALKFAKLGASTAKTVTNAQEAQSLIDTLFGCENAEFTPSGQRIISILTLDELEKRF
ncbi:MAG: DNA mismatch repair endonuclease MutL [Bacteroidales bacterium]|nr:DNA mismatch repair endonuclease MutL [Bacteroidales bacterium]